MSKFEEQDLDINETISSEENVRSHDAEQIVDSGRGLENFADAVTEAVAEETKAALPENNPGLISAVSSYGSENVQETLEESDMGEQLKVNQEKIETLREETNKRIVEIIAEESAGISSVETRNVEVAGTEYPAKSISEQAEAIGADAGKGAGNPSEQNGAESEKRNEVMEGAQKERGEMLKDVLTSPTVSGGLDLVPFAGGGKMVVEAAYGETFSGKELTGSDRVIHAGVGAASVALDCTGIGEVEKGAIIIGKSAVLIEKAGVKLAEKSATEGTAKIFAKTAEFMVEHPDITKRVEQVAEIKIREQINKINEYNNLVPPINA